MSTNSLTLKQIQEKLNVKQHVLIHLCEKGVIEPDLQETEGRGVHREFSERNLFEFALSLSIRRYEIPVLTTAAIIKLLRSFERSTQRHIKGFNLLEYLRCVEKNLDIELYFYAGTYLVFTVKQAKKFLIVAGFDLAKVIASKGKESPKIDHLEDLPDGYDSHLVFDLKQIARKIF
ncbi:MAG: hypothetical protein NT027_08280 [Proteobacteria bacterium]|nr:hypothetical protein [Pseudomonadota bacterium]